MRMPNLSQMSKSEDSLKENNKKQIATKSIMSPIVRKPSTRGRRKLGNARQFSGNHKISTHAVETTFSCTNTNIITDAGDFSVDEIPVAVPVQSPSTPHRINMPVMPQDNLIGDDLIKPFNIKSEIVALSPVQTVIKKTNTKRQKKLTNCHNGKHNAPKLKIESTNHKLTEFFPVRRSVRKCKKTVLEEKQRDIENKVLCQVEDGLKVQYFPGKGRGIVTTREFEKGEFVIEYIGELIDQTTAKKREQIYAQDQNTGCYMYYFQHRNQQYCVDATAETDKLGRLVNHSRNGNLIAKVVEVGGIPHLVLTAKEDIPANVEISYDYGDRSREAIRNHPWLAL